jgi:integrase/recombinase XerD
MQCCLTEGEDDLDLATRELTIRRGKGGKFRLVYLTTEAIGMIEDWLEMRGDLPVELIGFFWF